MPDGSSQPSQPEGTGILEMPNGSSQPDSSGQPQLPESSVAPQVTQTPVASTQPVVTASPQVKTTATPTPTATTKPAKVTVKTVKSSTSKTLKITWKKLSGVSGYQVCYSTKSSFSGNTKKAVSKSKNTVTIKKLKAGKTYYVKVRAYKTVNGKKSYGTWSKKYKIVVKK